MGLISRVSSRTYRDSNQKQNTKDLKNEPHPTPNRPRNRLRPPPQRIHRQLKTSRHRHRLHGHHHLRSNPQRPKFSIEKTRSRKLGPPQISPHPSRRFFSFMQRSRSFRLYAFYQRRPQNS